jgi:iron complex transport system permease protein
MGTSDAHSRDARPRFAWVDWRLLSVALGSTALVALALVVQVSLGTYSMSLERAWLAVLDADVWYHPPTLASFLLGDGIARALFGLPAGWEPTLSTATTVVWNVRLPRVLVGIFVGCNLGLSGAIFQAVTRNDLASPHVLGVSSGAGFAVLLALVLLPGLVGLLPVFAAVGGALAFLVVYAIAWDGGTSPVRLVLAGVVVWMICWSLQTALFTLIGDIGTVRQAIAWTTGSLTGVDWEQARTVLAWSLLVVLPGTALVARELDVLVLGESTAASLGMNVERVRFAVSALGIVAAGSAIAVAGVVAFAGLVVPHIVRTLVGPDHRRVLLGCVFVGPALLVTADVGARLGMPLLLNSPGQLPVGIVTGLVGGPYFLWLMRRKADMGAIA